MKKERIICLIVLCFLLSGCSLNDRSKEDQEMQDMYSRSIAAREYADQEFEDLLLHYDTECKIVDTSYGFYTSETPVYIVGYRYSNGISDDLTYAYKITVDDSKNCTIIEEGADTADFLFEKK